MARPSPEIVTVTKDERWAIVKENIFGTHHSIYHNHQKEHDWVHAPIPCDVGKMVCPECDDEPVPAEIVAAYKLLRMGEARSEHAWPSYFYSPI